MDMCRTAAPWLPLNLGGIPEAERHDYTTRVRGVNNRPKSLPYVAYLQKRSLPYAACLQKALFPVPAAGAKRLLTVR